MEQRYFVIGAKTFLFLQQSPIAILTPVCTVDLVLI